MTDLKQLCMDLEHFETPMWAAQAILSKEICTKLVYDPCVGSGILAQAAKERGYSTMASDIHDWGYPDTVVFDFLQMEHNPADDFTIFINPPFSKAIQFVERSFELGARKIIMFQRFAFWESKKRQAFWAKYPPNRIYICADRADCWRHDIPQHLRGSSTPTAHAWFVWEQGHPSGTMLGSISKKDAL